jgi:hypothetical protein
MPFTLVGWLEDIDQAAAYANLAALADQHVTVAGDDIRVPELNQIIAVAGCIDTTVAPRARLVSPSLRRKSNFMVAPLNGQAGAAQEPDSPQAVVDLRVNPIPLIVGENLSVETLANPAAVQDQSMLVWLSDKAITPVTGNIFTVRATSATAAVANAWTNVPIAFDEDLPRGRYQVVGLRPESAGMVAARCVFVGGQGWRPGALGCDLVGDIQDPMFRNGNLGVWGEFEDTDPCTVDVLSISADATQVFYFDLIQVREGPR